VLPPSERDPRDEGANVTETEAAGRVAALEAKVRELERERSVLLESEHRLRTVLDILPVGVWFTDAGGRIVLGNAAGQRVWAGARYVGVERYGEYRGWRADTGKRIDAEEWALARALRGETSLDEVIDIECFDGSRRTIINSAVPVRDGLGTIAGAVVINVDITGQKRTERQLQDALQRLRFHADNSPLAVVEWGADFRVTAWNAAAERMFGWTAAEVLGKTIGELRIVHPDDWEGVRGVSADMASGARPSSLNSNRNVRKDGIVIQCEWYNSALHDAAGELVSVLSLVLDVTDRKRAEARAESLARFPEENPDPVLRLAGDLTVLYANPAARSRLRELGVAPGRVAPPRIAEPARRAIREAERVKSEVECGGAVFSLSVAPVGDEVNVYAQDITARKQAEDALRDADRRKTEFLAVLSHELRNPLTPIRHGIHLLGQVRPDSQHAAQARQIIERQTEHLTRLVNDLLDVNRISRGRIDLQRVRLDACAAVRHACDDHRPVFDRAGVELRLELPPHPAWVDADATRLAQAIGNLLSNAVKFTREGGRVTAGVAERGSTVEIAVSDDGVGMEPEHVQRMFEPFAQGDSSLARTQGGLGLGLALVKGLVELHGGSVRARSDGAGRGAEFAFTLPSAPSGPAAVEQPLARRARPLSILIVEDNLDAGDSLAEILALEGHRVRVARDGSSGVALARALKPDVVLCDIGLPDMSGYEVAHAIRSDGALRRTRVVAVSGYAQREDVRRAAEAGFDAHLAKPLTLERLHEVLAGA
jgi:PAS domain S-box-containing protein